MKLFEIILYLLFFMAVNALASEELTLINDPKQISILELKLKNELAVTYARISKDGPTFSHLKELEKLQKNGKLRILFFTGLPKVRGMANEGDDCDCSNIYLNTLGIDTGIVSTLVHEFEHVKHDLLLGTDFSRKYPEIDELYEIFGNYYFEKDLSFKNHPKFTEALYIGSAYIFFTEYKAYRAQITAINEGVKDPIRTERTVNEVIETVANQYLIDRGITVDADYVIELASLAELLVSPQDFLVTIFRSKSLRSYFSALQRKKSLSFMNQ